MWRSKKFIIVAVLAAVLLAGSIGGIALANTGNGGESQPRAPCGALLDRVCDNYEQITGATINCTALKEAFAQARSQMRDEALENRLQKLVDEGVLDPEQATAYKEWLQARPDMEPFREWQKARPDVPIRFGFRGHGGFRGMGGMRGFGGHVFPQNN